MADFHLTASFPMASRLLAFVLALLAAVPSLAQKQRVERDADLPRFTYKIDGKLEDVVRDEAKFRRFATDLRRDTEGVLAKYDIADKASQRQYMTVLVM